MPGAEQDAIEQLAKQAAALKAVGVRVLARLSGVSTQPEAALREAANRALARAWGAPLGTGSPSRAEDSGTAPILELTAASHPQLAQIAVVSEFVTRLAASARSADVKIRARSRPRCAPRARRLRRAAAVSVRIERLAIRDFGPLRAAARAGRRHRGVRPQRGRQDVVHRRAGARAA